MIPILSSADLHFPGRDVLFSDSNFENQQETIKVLSLHILNHVMKTRKAGMLDLTTFL